MASLLRPRTVIVSCKGVQAAQLLKASGIFPPRICVALLRTGGESLSPHETLPVQQSTASFGLPSVAFDPRKQDEEASEEELSGVGAAAEKEDLLKKILMSTLTYSTKAYDTITLPMYSAVQQPWKKLAAHNAPKGVVIDYEKMEYGSLTPISELHKEIVAAKADTMDKVFSYAMSKHSTKKCVGFRDILSEADVVDETTRNIVKKYELSEYKWKTFAEVDDISTKISHGFATLGIRHKEKIAIFAETRMEWLLSAIAAFKRNMQVVTIFTTLADDGVEHAIHETDVCSIITSEELLPRLQSILAHAESIKNIVYIETKKSPETASLVKDLKKDYNVISYNDLMVAGGDYPEEETVKPEKNDRAIIMYTSGSTGVPKGVMISHWNLVCGVKSVLDCLEMAGTAKEDDAYLAYLPLAHVLELMSEAICFVQGIPIGYSSPHTMIDKSPGIQKGTSGDATLLKPTIMTCVPLVIERICRGITTQIAAKGKTAKLLFDFFYQYKVNWTQKGYETPILDKLFFSKISKVVGGKLRFMAVGSAPLAPESQEFIRTVLCCPVMLGYAMTESACSGSFGIVSDMSTGRVGPPVGCTRFRLVDWPEAGYSIKDKPYPRGEILIGGDNVALGYYKKKSSDFFNEDGRRWIKTGDIGEVHPDGVFKIIDRKKDLVKLGNGEFVSLGRVEAAIKTNRFVDNLCVYVEPTETYVVALVVPVQKELKALAEELRVPGEEVDDLRESPVIVQRVLEEINDHARLMDLNKFEIPKKIHLCSEVWTPQNGLVTAAFKIKRKNVYKKYEQEVAQLYSS